VQRYITNELQQLALTLVLVDAEIKKGTLSDQSTDSHPSGGM